MSAIAPFFRAFEEGWTHLLNALADEALAALAAGRATDLDPDKM